MSKKKKVLRVIIASVVSFITCIFLCFSAIFFTASWALSEKHLVGMLVDQEYGQKIAPYLEDKLNELTDPAGLPEHYFTGKSDITFLQNNAEACIRTNYRVEAFHTDTAALEQELIDAFQAYATENGITASAEAMKSLAKMCSNSYISYSSPVIFSYLAMYAGKIQPYAFWGGIAFLVLAAALLFFLWKSKLRAYFSFAFGGSGLMLWLLPAILLINKYIIAINIIPQPVKDYIVSFLHGILVCLLVVGVICSIAAIALLFICPKKEEKAENTVSDETSENPV